MTHNLNGARWLLLSESEREDLRHGKEIGAKYKLTKETIKIGERTLYRIEAFRNIKASGVKDGDKGGFIEGESNLSHDGDSWVCDNALVFDDALISDNALVLDSAQVYGRAKVMGDAQVLDNAQVFDDALISDNALVYGDARVYGRAKVMDNAEVYDRAQVYDRAKVCGDAEVCGVVEVYGGVKVSEVTAKHPIFYRWHQI